MFQRRLVTPWILLDLQVLGISHLLPSSSVTTSPAALDSNLIYSKVLRGLCCWQDSAVSHRWKQSEVCKIEFALLRRALGRKRLCTQVTFSAWSHLVPICWSHFNGSSNPSIQVGINSSSIVPPSSLINQYLQ